MLCRATSQHKAAGKRAPFCVSWNDGYPACSSTRGLSRGDHRCGCVSGRNAQSPEWGADAVRGGHKSDPRSDTCWAVVEDRSLRSCNHRPFHSVFFARTWLLLYVNSGMPQLSRLRESFCYQAFIHLNPRNEVQRLFVFPKACQSSIRKLQMPLAWQVICRGDKLFG